MHCLPSRKMRFYMHIALKVLFLSNFNNKIIKNNNNTTTEMNERKMFVFSFVALLCWQMGRYRRSLKRDFFLIYIYFYESNEFSIINEISAGSLCCLESFYNFSLLLFNTFLRWFFCCLLSLLYFTFFYEWPAKLCECFLKIKNVLLYMQRYCKGMHL